MEIEKDISHWTRYSLVKKRNLKKCKLLKEVINHEFFIDGEKLKFTRREFQCLSCLNYGYNRRKIAETLNISVRTVDAYIAQIRKKKEIPKSKNIVNYFRSIGILECSSKNIRMPYAEK